MDKPVHWKVGDGFILSSGKKLIEQIALFEITKDNKYVVVFYDADNNPLWLTPLIYDKALAGKYTREEFIKKYKLNLDLEGL